MSRTQAFRKTVFLSITFVLAVSYAQADWPQFRGPNSSGHGTGSVPTEFGPGKNELWSVTLKPGHSSPCIAGDSIFVTTFDRDQKKLAVVCLDRKSGQTRWTYPIKVDAFEKGHPSFNPASSSPASDGQVVVAYFGSYGLICLDMSGQKKWDIKMPITKSYAGNATSPAIYDDRVILYRGNHVDHYLLAVDKATGEEFWRVDQDEPFASELACTSCPIRANDKLIVHSARSVQAFDLKSGSRVWVAKCATTATSTPILADNQVLVAAWNKMGEPALRPEFPSYADLIQSHDKDDDKLIGRKELPRLFIFHRPDGAEAPQNGFPIRFDHVDKNKDKKISSDEWGSMLNWISKFREGYETHGVLAIPLESAGVVDPKTVRTLETQGVPEVPSPLYRNGVVYFVKNGGVMTCVDLKSGERLCRIRTGGKGTHYASPILSDGKIFSTAGDGTITVLSATAKPEILAVNKMNDKTYATPAIDKSVLYIRTHSKLYAFGSQDGGRDQ